MLNICLFKETSFLDHSLPVNDPNRVRDGTISDLYECAVDEQAKILSATGFPLIGAAWSIETHSTDYVAWCATARMAFAKENVPLPVGDFTFGGAAAAGAAFWWRFAPHGLGMSLKVKTGGLVLLIGRPIRPLMEETACTYQSYDIFADPTLLVGFSETNPSPDVWTTEAVYLDDSTDL